jgi:N-acetylneuraminic acid mutarotase
MAGSSTVGSNGGQSGVYGVLRTPAAGNVPGGRYGAANWTDGAGHFWLFGGYGYDVNGNFGYLNDLWEFNPSTVEWAWMSGSDTVGGHGGQPGVYGTLGTAAAGNTPGSRNFPATWIDSAGNLWLFGGWDYDADAIAGELNDLWQFDPSTNEWTWMGGSSTAGPHDGQSGTYGTLGTAAPGNTPGGLFAPSSWTDGSGDFWLFGGQGFDGNGNFHELNSLWDRDAVTTEWAWMGGSKTVGTNGDVPGVYGTLGAPAAGNIPGNRSDASSWTGGGLWLFGGTGYDSAGNGGFLNDLWEFNPALNQWAWMSGSNTVGSNGAQSGVYGALGIPAAGNAPGGRDDATAWTDANGNLWLLGGFGADSGGNGGYLNDVWVFNPGSGDWAWMAGSSTVGSNGGQPGVYGTLGVAAAGNIPGGREAASGWTDSSGNLWLFGGYGYDASGNLGYLNDLWKVPPSATSPPATATPTFSPSAGTYASSQAVTISDATAGATIYYTTNGTAPTVSSAVYAGPVTIASSETLEAIATASGHSTSAAATAAYTINLPAAAAPTFSPVAGTYAAAQTVTISDSTAGATIYYTTTGTAPTVSSAVYAGPITVSSTETIEAIAAATGHSTSPVATAAYTINLPAGAFAIGGTDVTVTAGATTGNTSSITVTPSGGFTGSIALTAAITATPSGAQDLPTVSFGSTSPVQIIGSGTATATLTVTTIAVGSATLARPALPGAHRVVLGGAALACVLLFCVPARRRWQTMLGLIALLAIFAGGAVACGSSVTRNAVTNNPGTTSGAYTVTVTGSSGAIVETGTIIVHVE